MKAKKTMKAIIASAMVSLLAIWVVKIAVASPVCGHTVLIVPEPDPEEDPRSPVHNPFIAELMDGNDSVLLGATTPCGIVAVQISSTAGDSYSSNFNTATGAILLPISGNAGYYTLTITTSDGSHFVGNFTI